MQLLRVQDQGREWWLWGENRRKVVEQPVCSAFDLPNSPIKLNGFAADVSPLLSQTFDVLINPPNLAASKHIPFFVFSSPFLHCLVFELPC